MNSNLPADNAIPEDRSPSELRSPFGQHAGKQPPLVVFGLIGMVAVAWTVIESLPIFMTARYSLYQIVWMRYAAHLVALAVLLGPRRALGLLRTPRPGLQIGRGLLMLAMPAAFITAIGRTAAHNALAIFWLSPVMILALAAAVLRERADWLTWLGAAVSVAGAQLILQPDVSALGAGAPLALVMGLSFSLYVVLTRSLRTEPRAANLLFTAVCVFLPLSIVMLAVWQTPSLQDVLVMTTIGLVGLGLLWALDRACEEMQISDFAALMPLQLVCGVVLASAMGRTLPGKMVLAGCGLVAGVTLFGFVIRAAGKRRHVKMAQFSAPVEITCADL